MSGILPVIKFATSIVATVGVSKVVGDIVKNNVTVVTQADKLKVMTGGYVIGSIVVDAALKQVDARVTEVANFVEKHKKNKDSSDEEATTES